MAFVQDGYLHAKWIHGWNLLDKKGQGVLLCQGFFKMRDPDLKSHKYFKVVIEVDDKQATAERLREMPLE